MNDSEPEIEIFKPFGAAFELTKKILFRPFEFKKWLVFGFAAWLANLGSGGGSFSYQFDRHEETQKLNYAISQISHPILVIGVSLLIFFVLVLIVLFAWLRARGGFMFIDCVVRNRGAIAESWREFKKDGNRYFLFSLLITFIFAVFAALLALPLIMLAINGHHSFSLRRDRLDLYLLFAITGWVFVILFVVVAWSLITSFMLPVMYRRRCRPYEALRAAVSLVVAHPGEIVLYCLFLIALFVASGLISCFAICLTCCIAALPYLGTVILLPLFVLFRSFSLLFLRQFGPDYDVWATFMPPEFLRILSGAPPVPPEPPLPPMA
jgi:MFS family permease